jgi:hypothetical protein
MNSIVLLIALLAHNPLPVQSQDTLITFSLNMMDMEPVTDIPEPSHVKLGVYFAPVPSDSVIQKLIPPNYPAVRIRQLVRGMSADKAGIMVGDVIFALDGKPLSDTSGQAGSYITNLLRSKEPGDVVKLKLARRDKILTIPVKLKVPDVIKMPFTLPAELGEIRKDSWLALEVGKHDLKTPLTETLRQIAACADMESGDVPFTDRPNPWRLNAITYLAHHPFRTGAYSRLIVNDLWNGLPFAYSLSDTLPPIHPKDRGLSGVVTAAGKHLDVKPITTDLPPLPKLAKELVNYFSVIQSSIDSAYFPVRNDLPRLKKELLRILDAEDGW